MLFNSVEFLIYLPIVFLLYFITPKLYRSIILLIASYIFYMWWNVNLVFLIAFTTILSYLCAIQIEKTNQKKNKKFYLILALVGSLGILIFFKYFNFLANSIVDIINAFGGNSSNLAFNILLPVGISFYTFQTLSYVIDVYREKITAEKNLIDYALFVSFFPQLVAGPIERPENLLPQLKEDKKIKVENLKIGLEYILIGFFKKIAVADMVGIIVNKVYNNIDNANGLAIAIASILFAVQILCDFSGYSDIAVGCAKLFGINLMKNFDKPYRSKSIKEFWTRWHISLSSWFKDYLYFPLGGNKKGTARWVMNILLVFVVSGLWHGAAYTFLLWGLLHGIYQVIGKLTKKTRLKLTNQINPKLLTIIQIAITFILVDLSWVIFRANNTNDMVIAFSKIFTNFSLSTSSIQSLFSIFNNSVIMIFYIVIVVLGLYFIDLLLTKNFKYKKVIYIMIGWIIIGAWIYLQSQEVPSNFIYFQF